MTTCLRADRLFKDIFTLEGRGRIPHHPNERPRRKQKERREGGGKTLMHNYIKAWVSLKSLALVSCDTAYEL